MWNRTSRSALLWAFLRERCWILSLAAVWIGVSWGVFSLYQLEAEAVWYAATLCFVPSLIWGVVDFVAYVRRRRALEQLMDHPWLCVGKLPTSKGGLEGQYQTLITALHNHAATRLNGLETRNRETEAYYTTWVHQIKTPIAALYLLLREEKTDLSSQLSAELLKVEQYVEMVLGYLRLDSASSDYVFRRFDLEPVVRQAVRRFAPQFIRKKLNLAFGPVTCGVVSDEKWLLFCIEQLLSNAIKYTQTGGICIYTDGETLVIADSGIGIAPEDLPRVFEKGYTGYNGRGDQKSTGIGLYLCRRILDRLGHEISITSQVGSGTTVHVGLARRETVYE